MREKAHSPRKMLPSPKQGSVYPIIGLTSTTYASHVPYDLSATARTSSTASSSTTSAYHSSFNYYQQNQHYNLKDSKRRCNNYDQPLDLRLAHKKHDYGDNDNDHDAASLIEDENSNLILSTYSVALTTPTNISTTTTLCNNNNNNESNNNMSECQQSECTQIKNASFRLMQIKHDQLNANNNNNNNNIEHIHHNTVNMNNCIMSSSKKHLRISKSERRASRIGLLTDSLHMNIERLPVFPTAPHLHPSLMEAMAKVMPLSYNNPFVLPRPPTLPFMQSLKKELLPTEAAALEYHFENNRSALSEALKQVNCKNDGADNVQLN